MNAIKNININPEKDNAKILNHKGNTSFKTTIEIIRNTGTATIDNIPSNVITPNIISKNNIIIFLFFILINKPHF